MTTNERNYRTEINNGNEDYKISIADFIELISADNRMKDSFQEAITSENDLFFIACDFSIPVSMVKYFKKVGF